MTEAEVALRPWNRGYYSPLEESTMKETPKMRAQKPYNEQAVNESEKLALEQATKDAEAKERARVMAINETVKALGLRQSFANDHIEKGTPIDIFRELAIKAKSEEARMQVGGLKQGHQPIHQVALLKDEIDKRIVNLSGALLEKFTPGGWSYTESEGFQYHKDGKQRVYEGSRQYVGMSLLDMAKDCLEYIGVPWRTMNKSAIVSLAFQSTSDFPLILADSANKALRAGYGIADSPWRLLAARRTATDFKTRYELTLDSSSRLEKVPESGEFTRGTLVEGREPYKLATYGKILGITRQAIINDDLDAFTRLPFLMGQEVAVLEAETVTGILNDNSALSDGVALFDADNHKNLSATEAAISVDSIGILRTKLRVQTGSGGKVLGLIRVTSSYRH